MQDLIDLVFSSDGPLSRALSHFEERPEQKEMAQQILSAYLENEIALIEAGTGTGKSLAYLIPALFWAKKHQERTVISTHTIALQEQLIQKDIPFLLKALQLDLKVCLIKGMANYLCLRKLEMQEDAEASKLKVWAESAEEGSRSEVSFPLAPSAWEKVAADPHACNNVQCPHYKECFFFRARKEAQDAQIIVINHHLLFTDLAAREEKEGKEAKSLLPAFSRLVLDEAHHLEEIAIECLSKRVDYLGLLRLLSKASPQAFFDCPPALLARIEIDLPAKKRVLTEQLENGFYAMDRFLAQVGKDERVRLQENITEHPTWKGELKPLFSSISTAIRDFSQMLYSLDEDGDGKFALRALGDTIEQKADILQDFFTEEGETRLRWIERSSIERGFNIIFISALLDVSNYLQNALFSKISSASLCSATLATNQNFEFVRHRLGLQEKEGVTEKIYTSPFDYEKRTLLLVPTDLPDPTEPAFNAQAGALLPKLIDASQGSVFILFTSYEMLRSFHALLLPFAEEKGYPLLKQGEVARSLLLEKFKQKEGSILLGTDSFWEGVDVAGEALRSVIIMKLPFKVPNDPLVQGTAEILTKQGKNPFIEYAVPQAAIKFKQGFGRLMRQKTDRGCIVCLDKRLINRPYGKTILKSLPPSPTCFEKSESVVDRMQEFYARTGA